MLSDHVWNLKSTLCGSAVGGNMLLSIHLYNRQQNYISDCLLTLDTGTNQVDSGETSSCGGTMTDSVIIQYCK